MMEEQWKSARQKKKKEPRVSPRREAMEEKNEKKFYLDGACRKIAVALPNPAPTMLTSPLRLYFRINLTAET